MTTDRLPKEQLTKHGWLHGHDGSDEIPGIVEVVPLSTLTSTRDPFTPVTGDILVGNSGPDGMGLYAIVVPAANVRNVLGVDNGETVPTWKTALDATDPADVAATAAPGTSLVFSHRDHVHKLNILTTKGDILVYSSGAPARLAVGTNGQRLVADSTATPGLKWDNTCYGVFEYDFATDGGAVGAINLRSVQGLNQIPDKFVIIDAEFDVITAITGGAGTTGALSVNGADDLVAATVVSGAPWSSTGQKATLVLPGTIGTRIKTTAARTPQFTVAVNAVTAGKFRLIITGYQSA